MNRWLIDNDLTLASSLLLAAKEQPDLDKVMVITDSAYKALVRARSAILKAQMPLGDAS